MTPDKARTITIHIMQTMLVIFVALALLIAGVHPGSVAFALLCVFIVLILQRRRQLSAIEEMSLFSRVTEICPAGIIVLNPAGKTIYANHWAEDILGRPQSALEKLRFDDPIWQILDEHDLPIEQEKLPFARVMATGRRMLDCRQSLTDGHGIRKNTIIHASPLLDKNATIQGVVITIQDVTLTDAIHRALDRSLERSRALFVDCPSVMLLINPENGRIIDANHAAADFYGYSIIKLKKMNISDISTSTVDEIKQEMTLAVEQERNHFNFRHRLASGIVRDVEVFSGPINFGDMHLLFSIVHDVSDKVRIEREARSQQRMRAIGTLAGGVAHEINNPLNGILNYAQLITDQPQNPSVSEYAAEIGKEAERINRIIRNLMSFARPAQLTPQPEQPDAIINDTLSLIKTNIRHDNIRLSVDIAEGLPCIECRKQQIQQALMNLLMNARDAVNKHHPGHNADKHIRISAVRHALNDQPAVLISVEDNGAGLDGLANEQLFDPFFTTKPRHSGSGLGLSICREIIQGHHGKVWFERIPEGGTVFHIALPLQQHSDNVSRCHEQNTDS